MQTYYCFLRLDIDGYPLSPLFGDLCRKRARRYHRTRRVRNKTGAEPSLSNLPVTPIVPAASPITGRIVLWTDYYLRGDVD